jgi:hypothetical protein
MKYSIFSLFALSLFLFANCQNGTGSGESGSETAYVAPITPAADKNTLAQQILTDFLEAQKESKKYAAAQEETFQLIKTMKMSWGSQNDAGKAHIEKLVKDAMEFYMDYEVQKAGVSKLESLSTQVMEGSIAIEDAQKEYLNIRKEALGAGGLLQAKLEKVNAVKAEWARDFPGQNTPAPEPAQPQQ